MLSSSRTTRIPCRASRSAAATPATPAPTMATSTRSAAIGADLHPVADLEHARALVRKPVHGHAALLAHAHPAQSAAAGAFPGRAAQGADAGRGQRGKHRFAGVGSDRHAVHAKPHGSPARA